MSYHPPQRGWQPAVVDRHCAQCAAAAYSKALIS